MVHDKNTGWWKPKNTKTKYNENQMLKTIPHPVIAQINQDHVAHNINPVKFTINLENEQNK